MRFYNPLKASKHVNQIWQKPNNWWESKKMKEFKKHIFKEIGDPDNKNWKNVWRDFLKK